MLKQEEAQAGNQREEVEELFEEFLGDFGDEAASEEDAQEDAREEGKAHFEGPGIDDLEVCHEGDFEDIEEKKEACADAEEVGFFEAMDEGVDGVDRSGGIRHHGGDTNREA